MIEWKAGVYFDYRAERQNNYVQQPDAVPAIERNIGFYSEYRFFLGIPIPRILWNP